MEVLTRSETLQALYYMGVDLPPTTRLPDDVLDKRLRDGQLDLVGGRRRCVGGALDFGCCG